jgi:hypothetical protein
VLCPRCGAKNDDDINFCSSCGASQERLGGGDTQSLPAVGGEETPLGTPAVAPARRADVLVVNSGPSIGARFEVGADDVSAGRSVSSDIFLDDVTVSRSHARFVRTDSGRLAVQDAGSLNGTYVNHVRVEEKILDSGDEIQIGKFKLIYLAATS